MKNFDFSTYEITRRYFQTEMEMRQTHFRKYIEMWIEEYFGNEKLTSSFEYEVVWRYWNDFETSVFDFIRKYQDEIPSSYAFKDCFEKFKEDFYFWRNQWLKLRRKNKNGKGIEGSSKFQTLVRKVMKEQKFEERVNYFLR